MCFGRFGEPPWKKKAVFLAGGVGRFLLPFFGGFSGAAEVLAEKTFSFEKTEVGFAPTASKERPRRAAAMMPPVASPAGTLRGGFSVM